MADAETPAPSPDSAEIHLDAAPQILNERQVAFVLDIDLSEVRRLKRRKLCRWLRFGGQDYAHTEDVRALLSAKPLHKPRRRVA
jgi:hypothetical protein